MALQLYEHPLSPYVRKCKIVLYEKGIEFERVSIAPMTLRPEDPAFAAFAGASPRLEVPCLVDGAFRCSDSTIIVDYLDEKWPDRPMLGIEWPGRITAIPNFARFRATRACSARW